AAQVLHRDLPAAHDQERVGARNRTGVETDLGRGRTPDRVLAVAAEIELGHAARDDHQELERLRVLRDLYEPCDLIRLPTLIHAARGYQTSGLAGRRPRVLRAAIGGVDAVVGAVHEVADAVVGR